MTSFEKPCNAIDCFIRKNRNVFREIFRSILKVERVNFLNYQKNAAYNYSFQESYDKAFIGIIHTAHYTCVTSLIGRNI